MFKKISNNNKPKFYSGWRQLKLLLFVNPFKSEILKTINLRRKLKLNKIIRFNNKFYSSLIVPAYPSKTFENMVKNGGLNFRQMGTKHKRHLDLALIAVNTKCNLKCKHCYEKHNINQTRIVSVEHWKIIIEKLQSRGVSVIVLTGGEPLLEFKDVIDLLDSGNKELSDFHIHTSGFGVTIEKAKELKEAGLTVAAVGFDDVDPNRFDILRGYKGAFDIAVNALKCFNKVGILTYVNTCTTKEFIHSGKLYDFLDLMKSFNVSLVQLLEPRPCGGFIGADDGVLLDKTDKEILTNFFITANTAKKYKDHPLVYYVAYIEAPDKMGCTMGGLSHFYIDSLGNVNPCVFMPVSFGNVLNEDFDKIYSRMRKNIPNPIHKTCPSLLISDTLAIKRREGENFPIPFETVREEWRQIIT